MNRKAGWAATAALIAAGVAYQYLIYQAAHGGLPAGLRLTLKGLPLLLFAWWAATHPRQRVLALLAMVVAAGALYWVDVRGFGQAAYGIPHAVVYLSLGWLFGHTLAPGHEPLITGLARRVHGTMPPEMVVHTRYVTWAWTLFCVAQVSLSAALYSFAGLDAWSLFITVLNIPLLGLMFVVEYVVRVLRFPDHPQASIAQAIRAFTEHSKAASDSSIHRAAANDSGIYQAVAGDNAAHQTAAGDSAMHNAAAGDRGLHEVAARDCGLKRTAP
ncbi:MAG TPA: hypothetical protein VH105_24845 [Burkholderiales bacterium]|nr:hypothetical protein [Burkholderiales bacterium]